jgi:hypothetical protein
MALFLPFLTIDYYILSLSPYLPTHTRLYNTYCGMSAESQNCETNRELLLGNGSANTTFVRQWLSSRHVIAATDTHATTEEPLAATFSVWSVPSLYNEDQLPLGEWRFLRRRLCEMATSLRGPEPGNSGTSTVGRLYQAEQ